MVDRYVGLGGNDGNSGLSWALRKLTLNGVEDTPVVANDTVYVGPGVYRELLTCDVSGNAGNIITYIGDVTGENTDGVGGIVRVTGSDNDQAAARANVITANGIDYRTFRGFLSNGTSNNVISIVDGEHWILEDLFVEGENIDGIHVDGNDTLDIIIRRCLIIGQTAAVFFGSTGSVQNTQSLVENCILLGRTYDVICWGLGGVAVRNCLSMLAGSGVWALNLPGGFTACTVNNTIFVCNGTACRAGALGMLVEDYNTLWGNSTDRTNVNIGANSQTYPPLFLPPILFSGISQISGYKFPWWFGELSEWSQVAQIAGANEPTGDLRGIVRPTTASKNSWGPTQFVDMELESGTVQAGTYSRVLHDAGQVLARRVPVTGVQITITLYMRREANYAGNLPRMIIKQPGVADRTTVMTAAVNTWEQLSDTFTPSAAPGFVEVWAESRNTAAALAYEVFYDTMGVS